MSTKIEKQLEKVKAWEKIADGCEHAKEHDFASIPPFLPKCDLTDEVCRYEFCPKVKVLRKRPTCEECLEIDKKIDKDPVHLAWICDRKRHNLICLKDMWAKELREKLEKHFQSKPKPRAQRPFVNIVLYEQELELWEKKGVKLFEEILEVLL